MQLKDLRGSIKRSDGEGWISAGWISLMLAILFFALTFAVPPTDALGNETYKAGLYISALQVLSSDLISAGLAFLAIGSIVRAIYFLPGDVQKPRVSPYQVGREYSDGATGLTLHSD